MFACNISIFSFVTSSLLSSPYISLSQQASFSHFSISSSAYFKSFPIFFRSTTANKYVKFSKIAFYHIQNSAIQLTTEKNEESIKNENMKSFNNYLNSDEVHSNSQIFNSQKIEKTIIVSNNQVIEITDCVFDSLANFEGGSAVSSNDSSSTLIISRTGFKKCKTGTYGGAVYFNGQKLTIIECCFSECVATKNGQAILTQSKEDITEVSLSQSSISHCSMTRPRGNSGSLYFEGGTIIIFETNSSHNVVAEAGASVSIWTPQKFNLKYFFVYSNSGRSIFDINNRKSNANNEAIYDSQFSNVYIINNVIDEGGSIFNLYDIKLEIISTAFQNNGKKSLLSKGGNIILTQCMIDVRVSAKQFCNCEYFINKVQKVRKVDINMKNVPSQQCWLMGKTIHDELQHLPQIVGKGNVKKRFFGFFFLMIVGGIPTLGIFVYGMYFNNESRNLDNLVSVEIE
ncbi:hypothetical protein TRFO_14456 [Tritrichomonas foetus]|uniref:Right handed beta helix domain-containing protein n=1 Tax=Tritrichomonas foetus TaxID=1144522 RepID=A0A1J4KV44_9EUKA|nr:hypothetical protein TRFO_14456 [Tritrichomonas foetus]|eukprot:OHT15103.1 hypothetical protein TRFO_14456 [Tritrichomonas foetus]